MTPSRKSWAQSFEGQTADKTMFSLAANWLKSIENWPRFIIVAWGLLLTIFTINAIWAIYGTTETVISGWLIAFFPLQTWAWVFGGVYIFILGLALMKRDLHLRNLILMLIALNLGVFLTRYFQTTLEFSPVNFPFETYTDWLNTLYYRSFLLLPLLPMGVVYWAIIRKEGLLPLRFGDLKQKTRLFFPKGKKQNSWSTILARYWIFIVFPVLLLMQIPVGFEPILSGKIFIFLIPILVLALFNALAEDLLFQGFILPNIVSPLGPALGIFLLGLFFGLLHFGASPAAIAGLPQALIIGFFAWMGAKAVVETGGIGFAVLGHMGADVAIFSANFI